MFEVTNIHSCAERLWHGFFYSSHSYCISKAAEEARLSSDTQFVQFMH